MAEKTIYHGKNIIEQETEEIFSLSTIKAGQGVFTIEKKPLRSNYEKKIAKKHPEKLNYLMLLEREATEEVTSAIHGMCRDQLILHSKEYPFIKKELNKK